ncbi:MAG TPA: TetR family transcriptional regulator [Chthoniobacteraceae bacterium]
MRRAQSCALDLFEQRGFASVSMVEIAEQSEVSVASLFRYFGTKEQVVLWDEHDDRIIAAVAAGVERRLTPLAAVASGVAAALEGAFGAKADIERRKMALIFHEPALLAGFRANTSVWSDAFAVMFAKAEGATRPSLSHRASAAAAAVLVQVCLEEWFGRGGRSDLATLIDEAFSSVGRGTPIGSGVDSLPTDQ